MFTLYTGKGGGLVKCRTCEHCGANLDFGERCDCQTESRDATPQEVKEQTKKDGGAENGRI